MQIYLVGGAVRDRLLGLPVYDRDWVVVGATPEAMQALGYQPVGKDFPVFLHPETHEEYALARTERKAGRGYQGFEFHTSPEVTLEQDLQRRDLTINAMAEDEQGRVIDPYGGQADLQGRLLRHVSPAFAEDPLRVLRVARFAARFDHLGFRVAPETLQLMNRLTANGELADLSAERVWKELERALGERSPWTFFTTLSACGGLDHWLPELRPLCPPGAPAPAALERIGAQTGSPATRLAVLLASLAGSGSGEALLERLKAPKAVREQTRLLTQHSADMAALQRLTPEQQLALYECLDLARRPERLTSFVAGSQALDPATDTDALARLCQQVESIAPATLVKEGFKGPALGQELRRRRLAKIAESAHV
ncbi:hypothetical protein [Motiliproteus sediminis]|uniref:hypothetical protein n=1 Tax=Motiliproteus sediminis TaxID=1468178 RepID=UPI001AEFD1A6|nr:hypothetical protein [Motiliproteus sediminis]